MKTLILTTINDGQLFFCREIQKKYQNIFIILEKKKLKFHCPSAISGINNIHSDFFNLKRIQFT